MSAHQLNSFQKWALRELAAAGHKASPVANWIRVNDELDLMSYSGVSNYIDARK